MNEIVWKIFDLRKKQSDMIWNELEKDTITRDDHYKLKREFQKIELQITQLNHELKYCVEVL